MIHEKLFTIDRWTGGRSAGRYGMATFKADDESNGRFYGVDPESILGAGLAAGARIKVTVELLEEGEWVQTGWPPPGAIGIEKWKDMNEQARTEAWDEHEDR